MKSIYLDWNVFSHLNEHPDLKEVIMENKERFVFPYSPAHFLDFMKSLDNVHPNVYLEKELSLFTQICSRYLLQYDTDKNCAVAYQNTPDQFFDEICSNEGLKKVFVSQDYGGFSQNDLVRNSISRAILSIPDPKALVTIIPDIIDFDLPSAFQELMSNHKIADFIRLKSPISNLKEKISSVDPKDAIKAIDNTIKNQDSKLSFKTLLDYMLSVNQINGHQNEMNEFTTEYLAIDLLGYRSDKQRSLANISTDAMHAYFASYCDYFVSDDKRCRAKAQAIYDTHGYTTKIINTEEFVHVLKTELYLESDINTFDKIAQVLMERKQYDPSKECKLYTENLYFHALTFFNQIGYLYLTDYSRGLLLFFRSIERRRIVYFQELDFLIDFLKDLGGDKLLSGRISELNKAVVEKKEYHVSIPSGTHYLNINTDSYIYNNYLPFLLI